MGKRKWLNQLIEHEYFPAIASLEDSPSGRDKAKELGAAIRDGWTQRGAKTLEQQQSLMDQTRAAIKDKFGKTHFSVNFIDFSRDEYFRLNTKKQESARNNQLHQQYIKNPDAIVAQAVRLLDSPEWADVAAGLAVLTGRRLNEVLKTAQFTIQSQWVVRFSGALKRRSEPVPLVFDIPTLTTAKRVMEATQKLRQITPTNANESKVAQSSDRHFHSLVPAPVGKDNLYAHLWRSLYCCIATFWYCPKHVDDLLFKAHIMGHFETLTNKEQIDGSVLRQRLEAFASQRHYRLYEIDDELIAYHNGKRKGIKLGLAGIQPLATFADGLPENQPQPMQRKRPSSFRLWRDDHDSFIAILNNFDGKTQPDKVSAWIHWSLNQLTQNVSREEAIASSFDNTQQKQAVTDINDEFREEEPQNPSQQVPDTQLIHPSIHPLQQPAASTLEVKLDKLLDVMAFFVRAQTQEKVKGKNGANGSIATTPPSVQPQPVSESNLEGNIQKHSRPRKYKTGEADTTINSGAIATTRPIATTHPSVQPQSVSESNPEDNIQQRSRPRKYKTGEADTTINAAINAIIQHNNQPDLPHDAKWAITINGLKNFSTNQRAIERIMSERKDEIDNHLARHQLQPRHNDRHKHKFKINQVIQI